MTEAITWKILPTNWRRLVVTDGVDLTKPGLYEWRIEGVGVYIGKYTDISRPTRAYDKHVENLLNGKMKYRPSNPTGYRRIHHALIKAHLEGRQVTLTIIENAEKVNINYRERTLILERNATLNGRSID
jgi:hypothetical protein